MALSPDHPLATALAKSNPELTEFIAECHRLGTAQAAIETRREEGFDTGLRALHPFDPSWTPAGLCRQFRPDGLRHRRDLRLPAHDQRDLDFVREIRLSA